MPWPGALAALRASHWTCVALSPDARAPSIESLAAELSARPRVALFLGHEYDGLSALALGACELRLRIPIAAGVDSLNVAAASAIALHRLAAL